MKKISILIALSLLLIAEAPKPFKVQPIKVDTNSTSKVKKVDKILDPVYSISLKKYPKWHAKATLKNGHTADFISVKSMMLVYLHQDYFLKRGLLEDKIDKIYVKDYLSGKEVEAKDAVYVFGSRVVGPHGDDLIPFATEANAKLFMMKNGGTKLLPYTKITKGLLRYLDM